MPIPTSNKISHLAPGSIQPALVVVVSITLIHHPSRSA
jgi:hypothetical protein